MRFSLWSSVESWLCIIVAAGVIVVWLIRPTGPPVANRFHRGHIVALLSGGSCMTVSSTDDGWCTCVWLDVKGAPHTAKISQDLLKGACQ